MNAIILQNISTPETRSIRTASMLMDGTTLATSSLEDLNNHKHLLENQALPVGSVEFVREAMRIAGITEPKDFSYPSSLRQYLGRSLKQCMASEVRFRCFVKPTETKLFTGFVFSPVIHPHSDDFYEGVQRRKFLSLPPETPVWVSEPVTWLSEWRFYILAGKVIGKARYDKDGDDSAPKPEDSICDDCIRDFDCKHPYTLDMGVLGTGETALVEVNDAWAIGLYGNALAPRDYLEFLRSRWQSLTESSSILVAPVRRN